MEETDSAVTESFGSTCLLKTVAPINRGSYGTVFRARVVDRGDFSGEDNVAVKVVHMYREVSQNAERCTRLIRNLQNLLDIKHPHLVQYHKLSIISYAGIFSEYRLVMDYYNDGDLAHLLNEIKEQHLLLEESAVIRYAAQLADGLDFLHRNSIVHGDLKPASVLVKRVQHDEHILCIGGFDDSLWMRRNVTNARDITNLRGTLRYMSPEMLVTHYVCLNEDRMGSKTDVWSLGCVVLDFINVGDDNIYLCNNDTGEKLNAGRGKISDTRFADLVADGWIPHVPDGVSKFLNDCLAECLRKESIKRILASDLLKRLTDFLADRAAVHSSANIKVIAPMKRFAAQVDDNL